VKLNTDVITSIMVAGIDVKTFQKKI